MSENSELLVKRGNERILVTSWLRHHNIKFDERASTEELIQLYRDVECGKDGN